MTTCASPAQLADIKQRTRAAIAHEVLGGLPGEGPLFGLLWMYGDVGVVASVTYMAGICAGLAEAQIREAHGYSADDDDAPELEFGDIDNGIPAFAVIGPDGRPLDNPDMAEQQAQVWAMRLFTAVANNDSDLVTALFRAKLEEDLSTILEAVIAMLELAGQMHSMTYGGEDDEQQQL